MASTNIHTFDGSLGIGTNNTSFKFDVVGGDTNLAGTTITTLSVTDTTNSTGTSDGALKIAGGLGVAKKLHIGSLLITEKLGIGLAGAATETVEVNGTTSATRVDIGGVSYGHVPSGVILMWHGDIASPPSGWAICDGTSGTPDLQGYMIIGRNGTYTAGSTGGNSDLTMTTGTLPGHAHTGTTDTDGAHTHASVTTAQAGQHSHSGDTDQQNQSHSHAGDTSTGGNHDHEGTTSNSGNHPGHGIQNQSHSHGHTSRPAYNFGGIGGHNGGSQTFNIGGWISYATIGFGVGNSGNHTHTLTITGVPQHTHELSVTDDPAHLHSISTTQNGAHEHTFTTDTDGTHLHTATTQQSGGGESFEKVPPYRAIAYIMKL
jgi:microcystin-dependent protein